ncbi:MAG TPA: chemotaxis protein CheA [Rhodanobacteraceae bacterium]|nr:chemotaxis protein CheA [Rhodanobacteraceae bacterium]
MDTATDNELLDAFLVEAGELLDALADQLIELETTPRDSERLNSVFRAFHTVKGGAGFLAVRPMVQLCHRAEELLNAARNQRCLLQPAHVDCLLQALDVLQEMMASLRDGAEPADAPAALMQQLQPYPRTASTDPATPSSAAPMPASGNAAPAPSDPVEAAFVALLSDADANHKPRGGGDDGISDDEFEHLLDELHGNGLAPGAPKAAPTDAIDDSEFESLLDSIYGKGGVPGKNASSDTDLATTPVRSGTAPATAPAGAGIASSSAATGARTAPNKPHADTTVRVDTHRIDALIGAAGELVLVRNRLASLTAHGASNDMERAVNNLDRVAAELQAAALRMRMQPIGRLFQRYPRIVRDLARQLGKEVTLELHGEDTDLDRALVESLADPLVHLLRNAVDHGIETPDVREQARKPRVGTIALGACQEGERILITISDDGRGMDVEVLRRKAVEKGIVSAEQAKLLEPAECHALIFQPGFSTRSEISDISGRGVGMDVVKTHVAALGGTIDIESTLGSGTTMRIRIPLTLAIMRVLMLRVGERLLALPLANVAEVFEIGKADMRSLDGRVVANHRGRPLPLSDLAAWAGVEPDAGSRMHVVVVRVGHRQLGLLAAAVYGREEVMVKPLGSHLKHLSGIAGATITGDGRVALVLDLVALADSTLPPVLRMAV